MSARGLLAFVVICLLLSAGVRPQEQTPSFRTSVDLVRVDALVRERGRPVAGLTARDFELLDNGVSQTIRVESLADLPLDVILAVDVSSSVQGPLLEQLVAGAQLLVGAMRPDDRGALVTFSQIVAVRHPFATNRDALRDAVAGLKAGGNTSAVDAAFAGLALAERGRPTLLLIFSDGLDTSSWLPADQILDLARRSEVVVDAVIVGGHLPTSATRISAAGWLDQWDDLERFLSELASATGGRVLDGQRGERLGERFVEALAAFRQRYQIAYSPTSDVQAGWHTIEVKVKGRKDATVRTRSGYSR